MVRLISAEQISASEIRKHFSLLARLETAYSLNERDTEDLGKHSGCFMILGGQSAAIISIYHFILGKVCYRLFRGFRNGFVSISIQQKIICRSIVITACLTVLMEINNQ